MTDSSLEILVKWLGQPPPPGMLTPTSSDTTPPPPDSPESFVLGLDPAPTPGPAELDIRLLWPCLIILLAASFLAAWVKP